MAIGSLGSSKLRSFLTLLGIILATSTLIAVMSVIHGMDVYIAQNVIDMGADGFRVVRMAFIGNFDPKRYLELLRKNPVLERDEYEFVRSRATLVRELGMQSWRRVSVAWENEQIDGVTLLGTTSNMAAISNTQAANGRYFTPLEDNKRMAMTFIGNDIKERFFPNTDPVGKPIRINGRPYEVIGAAKARGSVFGQSRDNFVTIPVETYFKTYGARAGVEFVAQARDPAHLFQAQDEIRMLLRAYRHLRPGQEDNFAIFASDSIVDAWQRMTGAIAATAVAVVSVFMVVGGVVIMNIMLAVVTERTHEIGVRKSLGARRRDILNQFLVESAMLAASGGVIGVALAAVLALLVRSFTPVPMSMPATAVFAGVTLSAAVGLFFGIYPAHRASRLDPIEALRNER